MYTSPKILSTFVGLGYSNTTIKEARLCLLECCAAELLSLCPVPTNPRFGNRRGGILSYTWDRVSSSRGNEIFFVPPERVRFHLAPLPAPRDRRGKHSDLRGEFEHGGAFRAKMSKHIFHVNVLAFTVAICQLEIPELQPVQFMVVTGSPGTKNTCEMDPHPPRSPPTPKQWVSTTRTRFQVLCWCAGRWWCRRVLDRDSPACGGSVPVASARGASTTATTGHNRD